jgi:two-component system cell cycle response regulator
MSDRKTAARAAKSPAPTPLPTEDLAQRVKELEDERRHLLAMVEILQAISGALNFVDILQAITQKLGETFGLDRCSIFLAEPGGNTARLVASYEDPSIRNYIVDLKRYPELKRALQSGETVFIPDAQADPNLKHIRAELATRKVKTITVVPISWRQAAIGAIFLRTFRDGAPFSEMDIKFCQVVCGVTARALRTAHRFERMAQRQTETSDRARRSERERIALVAYLNRLLTAFAARTGPWSEGQLGESAAEEIERLVGLTMAVLEEEGKTS